MNDNTQKLGLEFASYLSEKLKKSLECIQITRIFGGASRETFLVELLEKENNDLIRVILRRSQKSSLIETDQETEYKAYSVFQNSDVPVPKLITLEKSSKPLGAPFLVMEQLEGEAGNPFDNEAYKPHAKEIGQQFWSILGTISCLDISKKEFEKF